MCDEKNNILYWTDKSSRGWTKIYCTSTTRKDGARRIEFGTLGRKRGAGGRVGTAIRREGRSKRKDG